MNSGKTSRERKRKHRQTIKVCFQSDRLHSPEAAVHNCYDPAGCVDCHLMMNQSNYQLAMWRILSEHLIRSRKRSSIYQTNNINPTNNEEMFIKSMYWLPVVLGGDAPEQSLRRAFGDMHEAIAKNLCLLGDKW